MSLYIMLSGKSPYVLLHLWLCRQIGYSHHPLKVESEGSIPSRAAILQGGISLKARQLFRKQRVLAHRRVGFQDSLPPPLLWSSKPNW